MTQFQGIEGMHKVEVTLVYFMKHLSSTGQVASNNDMKQIIGEVHVQQEIKRVTKCIFHQKSIKMHFLQFPAKLFLLKRMQTN